MTNENIDDVILQINDFITKNNDYLSEKLMDEITRVLDSYESGVLPIEDLQTATNAFYNRFLNANGPIISNLVADYISYRTGLEVNHTKVH